MRTIRLLMTLAGCVSVSIGSLAMPGSGALAHAPIEWSDPPNDAVVEKVPETIKLRFAEDPIGIEMRTIEPEPRVGVQVKPVKIGERTYEVTIPPETITPDDNTMVLFIETVSSDGHKESGVYLLHVKAKLSKPTTTGALSTTTSSLKVALNGESRTEFRPPASGGVNKSTWLMIASFSLASSLVTNYTVKKRRAVKPNTNNRSGNKVKKRKK